MSTDTLSLRSEQPLRRPLRLGAVVVASWVVAGRLIAAPTGERPIAAQVSEAGYQRAEYLVPMRDGAKLYTVVYTPDDHKKTYPILLVRTAYSTGAWVMNAMTHSVGPDRAFDRDGYIFVYQDMRGLGKSEGKYVLGDLYHPVRRGGQDVDESTDAYDTIDWLIHRVPRNNGKVGIWGISAEGRTTIFALLHPHPALVAASPQAAPADFFIGDDVYHNGAFRSVYNYDFMLNNKRVDARRAQQIDSAAYRSNPWSYDFFLRAGSLEDLDRKYLHGAAPAWLDIIGHDSYDDFWKARNTPQYLRDVKIPVLNVGGWFDAEDFYGTLEHYKAIEASSPGNRSTLIVGPWNHGGWYYLAGDRFGDIQFGSKTAELFRAQVMRPFFRKYLKGEGDFEMPEVLAFNTGANRWRAFDRWPPKGVTTRSVFLGDGGRLERSAATVRGSSPHDSYVSDPNKPVPFTTEIRKGMGGRWIVEDQRLVGTRPDVLVYETDALGRDLTIAGNIAADLFVSSSGSDSDWIVKLIDVYPNDAANNPEEAGKREEYQQTTQMGGYQMLLSAEILRGKFRDGLTAPQAMEPNAVTPLHIDLPSRLHTFRAGHRLMVQIQSSWFPLYDRNPQRFIKISSARPEDFQPAVETVYRSADFPSHLSFDVLGPEALAAATYVPVRSAAPSR